MFKPTVLGMGCVLINLSARAALGSASVALTCDASTVPQGGTATVTVAVVPNTNVSAVTIQYEGETGQDEVTLAPYEVTHQFSTAGNGITATATVTYNNGDPPEQATVDLDVVGLTVTGSASPLRAWPTSYVAESNPPGKPIDQFNWTYSWAGGTTTYQDNDANGDDRSVWSGRILVSGTVSCSASVSGVAASAGFPVVPSPRIWSLPISCVEDNDPGWGSQPTLLASLGSCRDRDSDQPVIFVPRNATNWDNAYTVGQGLGPSLGLYYVSSCALKCQQETVINRYIKADGPTLGGYNFFQVNTDRVCFTDPVGAFIQAVMNHEYRGTPAAARSQEGHFGRAEYSIIDEGHDPKKHIESLSASNLTDLRRMVNDTIQGDEYAVEEFSWDEGYMWTYGPNWGGDPGALGVGQNSRWDPNRSSWTDCVNFPGDF